MHRLLSSIDIDTIHGLLELRVTIDYFLDLLAAIRSTPMKER